MNRDRVKYLCSQFLAERCSRSELFELKQFVADGRPETEAVLREALGDVWDRIPSLGRDLDPIRKELIFKEITRNGRIRMRLRDFLPYAAAVFVVLSAGALYLGLSERSGSKAELVHLTADGYADIYPGGNMATLTTAYGEKIILDEIEVGTTITLDGMRISKTTDGSLVYESASHQSEARGEGSEKRYNLISTPRGAQYSIRLSDGTEVTLNAESWLRYPAVFDSDVRDVEVWGEAYFDVKPDTARPFRVLTNFPDGFQQIEVVGTQFNVNSYDERKIKTTVVEGKVLVANGSLRAVAVIAGQQSEWSTVEHGKAVEVLSANVLEVAAWKDGLFVFDDESIVSILARLSRWYDVDFEYDPGVELVTFQGNYFRDRGLKNLLRNLEMTGKILFLAERKGHSVQKGRRIHVVLKK